MKIFFQVHLMVVKNSIEATEGINLCSPQTRCTAQLAAVDWGSPAPVTPVGVVQPFLVY